MGQAAMNSNKCELLNQVYEAQGAKGRLQSVDILIKRHAFTPRLISAGERCREQGCYLT